MPHILIVDSNPAAENAPLVKHQGRGTGENYAQALQQCREGLTFTIIAPYDGQALPPFEGVDGVVFTGSSVEWNTDDARARPIAEVMERTFAAGLPTLGSCNGMQLAASVLGGATGASPHGREDGFARDIQLTQAGHSHALLAGRVDGYAVPCVHRDEVTRLPEGALLLASNAHSSVQAFAYERDGVKFWGMQYHPELDPATLGPALGQRGVLSAGEAEDMARAEQDAGAAARLGLPVDQMQPQVRMTELRNWLASL